jgi:3-oxoacyl-[acyl-carrier-protein] synthase III
MSQARVSLGAIAYELGELRGIEQLPEMVADPDALETLQALGVHSYAQGEGGSDALLCASLRRTLDAAAIEPSRIDALVYAKHDFRDYRVYSPGLKSLMGELGLTRAYPYGVTLSACGNWHSAARLAASLLRSGEAGHVLVATAERNGEYGPKSRMYPGNLTVCSDGAASCLMSVDALEYEWLGTHQEANMTLQFHWDGSNLVQMLRDTVAGVELTCRRAIERVGISGSQIRALITNNYNLRVSGMFAQGLARVTGLDAQRVFKDNVARFAHAYAADNLINLADCVRQQGSKSGDVFLLLGTGPETWGASLLRASG